MDLVLKFGENGGGHSLHILWNICNEKVFFWYVMKYWKIIVYIYNELVASIFFCTWFLKIEVKSLSKYLGGGVNFKGCSCSSSWFII
jgi:hypothetical protein